MDNEQQLNVKPQLGKAPRTRLITSPRLRLFLRSPGATISAGILLVLIVVATFAPIFAPHDPTRQNLRARLAPPSLEHPMGADSLGRDVLSRVIYGSRVSIITAFSSIALAMAIGIFLGLFSALAGGNVDAVMMRVVDGLLCFPAILLGLALAAVLGPGMLNLIIVITIIYTPRFIRFVRGQGLTAVGLTYVEAGRALGASNLRLIFQHILPNTLPSIIIQASVSIGYVVLIEAALSFLGAGVQPPAPSWGGIMRAGMTYFSVAPWVIIFPGLVLSTMVLAVNLLGDALRDVLDPRMRL